VYIKKEKQKYLTGTQPDSFDTFWMMFTH